jgi:hypothetical protein
LPQPAKRSDDAAAPLEARVTSRRDSYPLALGGQTSEEFAGRFSVDKPQPAAPEVDLVLTLRNTTGTTLTLEPRGMASLHLVGPGTVNHPELPYQTGVAAGGQRPDPPKLVLRPGPSHSVPIKSLDCGHGRCSYWLLPGEYTAHVTYHAGVTPAPEGWRVWRNGAPGYSDVQAAPLRLKVVSGAR